MTKTEWRQLGEDISLLLFRLLLAYGFFEPFLFKATHFASFVRWLERLHFAFPEFNAYLVIALQGSAVIFLTLGLATRLMSISLIYHMLIAMLAVHVPNGFSARDNGYEIPLYYILMLFALFIQGAGRVSTDWLIRKKYDLDLRSRL